MINRHDADADDSSSLFVPCAPASAASCGIIPTHARTIDTVLRGGVRTRMLTEIVGESGSAKSHLCCQLALSAQLAFPSGASVVYVHTEGPPPVRRLRALATSQRFIELFGSAERASEALDRVYMVNALGDGDSMLDALGSLSAALRYPVDAEAPVRMIIVDSIAAPFRDEHAGTVGADGASSSSSSWAYTMRRAGTLHKATMLLKEYAARHDLACVVTNHVVDSMRASDVNGAHGDETRVLRALGEAMTSGRRVLPALGLAWGHCVNARCFVTRRAKRRAATTVGGGDNDGVGGGADDTSSVERTFRVVYAPHCAPAAVGFVIRDDGAWGAE